MLDRVIAGGGAITPAELKQVRIGVVKSMLANLDGDTEAAFKAALEKLKSSGVTVVDVEMPKLAELNGQVGFPLALYEAYDDMVAYLKKSGTGVSIENLAKEIASPDVKGTYDGLVIPRKLPGPNNTVADAKPAYDAAMKTARPALQALYRDTFAKNKLDAIAFPTVPKVAIAANPNFVEPRQLPAVHPEHRSRQQCRRARHPASDRARRVEQTAGRSRARRPRGERSQIARDRHGDGKAVRPAAAAVALDRLARNAAQTGWRRRCGGGRRAWRRCARYGCGRSRLRPAAGARSPCR